VYYYNNLQVEIAMAHKKDDKKKDEKKKEEMPKGKKK